MTLIWAGRIGRSLAAGIPFAAGFNATKSTDEKHMGSTPYGDASPTLVGTALPQDIMMDRAGNCRVRVGGRA